MTSRREFLERTTAASALATASIRIAYPAQTNANKTDANVAHAAVIQTVRGPLSVSKLGFTLSHEHVCSIPPKLFSNRASAVAKMVDKLKEARDAGIVTIVDLTTFDVGRDIRFGEEISRKSGVQIVACTGQHFFAPESLNLRTVDQIAEVFVREIERGIDDTGIKAGVIKAAARSDAMTPSEVKVFQAAARASKATGVPIATHTDSRRRSGEKQAEIFEAEGVRPGRVSLGHCDDTDDVNYLIDLARRGYTLGMDHAFYGMASGAKVPWQRRANYIKQLVDAGFGDKLFLSNDWELDREKLNPDGLLFNTRKTTPYLKQAGVSEREIHSITVANPQRFFGRSS